MAVLFRILASDGTTPVYTFPVVFDSNYSDSAPLKTIQHSNLRGKGSLIIDGGNESWTIFIKGVLSAADYSALVSAMASMSSTIVINTPYYLDVTGSYSYKVKRISPIKFTSDSLRTNYIEYSVELVADCW